MKRLFRGTGRAKPAACVAFGAPGYTGTTAATFAGILAYTEHTFGLSPLGADDAAAYPFTGAFDTRGPAETSEPGAPAAPGVRETHPPDPGPGKRPDLATPATWKVR